MTGRFMTNEVGCIVDLEHPQLKNYDGQEIVDLMNELNRLAEANEEQGLAIMTYLHDNYYDIWEEVNKEVFREMTKRFTLNKGLYESLDMTNCLILPILDDGRELSVIDVVELLNELHSRNKRLEEKIQRERTSYVKQHQRWSKEAENKIRELSEENERLKSDVEYWKRTAEWIL